MTDYPVFVLALGGPSMPELRPVFEGYQRIGHFGKGPKPWEEHEGKVVKALFERKNDKPSLIEAVLFSYGGVPLRINDYYADFGMRRGLWVATVAISGAGVVTSEGAPAPWPPQEEHCTQLVSCLSHVFSREWVQWMILPAGGRVVWQAKPTPKP